MTDRVLDPRRFYVYLIERDGVPVYVGKGTGNRIYQHGKHDRSNPRVCRMIERDRLDGTSRVTRVKVAESLTEPEAFALEVELIARYGREPAGTLVNMTAGGEGSVDVTDETRQRISEGVKRGRKSWAHSPETRERIRTSLTGRARDPETSHKAAESNRGRKRTEEQRARMSEAQKGNQNMLGVKRTPEQRERMSAWQRGRKMAPESIAKSAAARTGVKLSAEHRAALSAAKKGVPKSASHREATRAAMLGREIKPEWVEKRHATMAAKRAALEAR